MRQSTSAKSAKQKAATLDPSAGTTETPTPPDTGEAMSVVTAPGVVPAAIGAAEATDENVEAAVKAEAVKAEKTRKADKARKAAVAATAKAEKTEKAEKRASDTADRVKAETKADERATASVAAMFKALGDPTRLRILRYLRAENASASPDGDKADKADKGVVVGDVALHLACLAGTPARKATSTLSHHLKELRHAGLVTMERRGKNVVCAVSPEAVEQLQQVLGGGAASVPPRADEPVATAD